MPKLDLNQKLVVLNVPGKTLRVNSKGVTEKVDLTLGFAIQDAMSGEYDAENPRFIQNARPPTEPQKFRRGRIAHEVQVAIDNGGIYDLKSGDDFKCVEDCFAMLYPPHIYYALKQMLEPDETSED